MAVDFCKTCYLKCNHPGVHIAPDGHCNLCKLDVPPNLLKNFKFTEENYQRFLQSEPRPDAPYDCLFMYSGGKDSTYMLDQFVNVEQRRVLAYTFKIPFESEHAAANIENIREKIPTEYFIDADDDNVRKLMRHMFNNVKPAGPGKYLDEKLPCMICRSLYVIRAINFAFRQKIPFIIFCADPQQIVTTESDVRETVKTFYNVIGRPLAEEIFGTQLEDILFAPEQELPRIVFPFIAMRHAYDPQKMIAELKHKGLYRTSPLETHCSLFPLLNYYSFKHYDCSFYKLNMASQARSAAGRGSAKSTFSINFSSGPDTLATEEQYKRVVFDIAAGRGSKEEQAARLQEVFGKMQFPPEACRFLGDKFLAMRDIAADLGVQLSSVD